MITIQKKWRIQWIGEHWCDECGEHIEQVGAVKNGKVICPRCFEKMTGEVLWLS